MNVLTVTLNPAIDATYVVPRFTPGTAARAIRKHEMAGGKGNNVARILASHGHHVMATGFLGGATGKRIAEGLQQANVFPTFVELESGESRICHAILELESGRVSEVLEAGPTISQTDADRFLRELPGRLVLADVVVLGGSAPPGLDAAWLDDLGGMMRRHSRWIVDSSGQTLEIMLRHKPDLIKPNVDEMHTLIGHDASLPEIIDYAQEHLCTGNRLVLHSLGIDGACLIDSDHAWQLRPPADVHPVNTVGCGDALLAGFLDAMSRGNTVQNALRIATAFAAAAAQEEMAGIARSTFIQSALNQLPAPESLARTTAGSQTS